MTGRRVLLAAGVGLAVCVGTFVVFVGGGNARRTAAGREGSSSTLGHDEGPPRSSGAGEGERAVDEWERTGGTPEPSRPSASEEGEMPLPSDMLQNAERTLLEQSFLSALPPATDGAIRVISHDLRGGGGAPSLSPDGRMIAFVGYRGDGTSDVYLYSVEEGTRKNVSEAIPVRGPFVNNPRFSPDGETLAVCGFPTSGIWAVDIATGGASLLVDCDRAIAPNWSSDGRYITYTVASRPRSRIEVFDLESRQVVRTVAGEGNERVVESSFSPDGKSLAYVSVKEENGKRTRSLAIEPLDGGPVSVVSFPNHDVHTPVFSPNGEYIAYRGGTTAWGEVYVYGIRDKVERQATAGSGSHPVWLPDSKGIVFTSSRITGVPQVYKLVLTP